MLYARGEENGSYMLPPFELDGQNSVLLESHLKKKLDCQYSGRQTVIMKLVTVMTASEGLLN